MTKLKIGQVVFFLDKRNVVPVRITSEVKVRLLEGLKISYGGVLVNGTEVQINEDNIDDFFDSSKKIREHLLATASAGINAIVAAAVEASKVWDDAPKPKHVDEEEDHVDVQSEVSQSLGPPGSRIKRIQMPDGSLVNVDLDQ